MMPVSVDEAYLELAPGSDGVACAQRIRQRIMDATRCPASAGISCNMLLARLATKKAKPNGQYLLSWDDAPAYLAALPVGDLPGVGYDLVQRLNAKTIHTCTDLMQYPLPALKVSLHRLRQLAACSRQHFPKSGGLSRATPLVSRFPSPCSGRPRARSCTTRAGASTTVRWRWSPCASRWPRT